MGQQFKMLKQLQQMQAKMAKIQEELGEKTVTGTAGGGMVEVVANGHQKVLSVTVKPEVVDPADVEMLQDLVLAAVNDAMEKARELATREIMLTIPPYIKGTPPPWRVKGWRAWTELTLEWDKMLKDMRTLFVSMGHRLTKRQVS